MDGLGHLLASYAGVVVFNLLLAVALWWKQRERLSLALLAVWSAGAFSLVVQGALREGAFAITLGYSSTFLTSLSLAYLLAELTALALPLRTYVALFAAGLATSFVASRLSTPFWAVSLPTAVGLTVPLAHTNIRALRQGEVTLTTTGKAFILVGFAFVLHTLDYPFMRPHPELAAMGFTIALVIVFPLSVTALAVVLERVAGERARLAELEALKSRFFANISHELRTPLTLILAPLQHVLDGDVGPSLREPVELAQRSASRLLRLIDDILDLSRLEAGALTLRVASVDVAAMVERIVEAHQPTARDRGQSLVAEVQPDLPRVLGDAHRLEMVLTNLVANATKHANEGGQIRVRAHSRPETLVVEVRDDGPGIPPHRQAQVFDRFAQGNDGAAGVGIGLALARELAELHGGALTLRSAVGHGSSFTLSLPRTGRVPSVAGVEPARASSPPPTWASPLSGHGPSPQAARAAVPHVPIAMEGGRRARIVVAEDDPDLRAFIVSVLQSEADVVAEPDGRAALERVRRNRPDLVVTDVRMPWMTGTELCRALKASADTRDLPVVMLTAPPGVEAAIEGFDAGADDFVAKPFHPGVLRARVRSHLTVRQLALRLADQARLTTAGTLAAGVAHEVRNPLNAVTNAAQILRDLGPQAASSELLAVIVDGASRIASVVDALDVHAQPADGLQARPCNLQDGLESTLRLLQHRAEHLTVDVRGAEGRKAWVPARAFHQVLTNLLDNALLAARSRVEVRVAQENDEVRITVDDDGEGVSPDHAQNVFLPFFTTRDVGEGRGLGLYVSRRLARDAGGELWLEPGPLGGARFVLRLPCLEPGARPRAG